MIDKPIPPHLLDAFRSRMDAADDGAAEGGAWIQKLEDAAHAFLKDHRLCGDATAALHQYLSPPPK